MAFDQLKISFKVFDQSGAVLDPIAAIHVAQAVEVANFRAMNVAADDAVHAVFAGALDE